MRIRPATRLIYIVSILYVICLLFLIFSIVLYMSSQLRRPSDKDYFIPVSIMIKTLPKLLEPEELLNISTYTKSRNLILGKSKIFGSLVVIHDLTRPANSPSPGFSPFQFCPHKGCFVNTDPALIDDAHVVIFMDGAEDQLPLYHDNITFIYIQQESTANLRLKNLSENIDFVASYRKEADFYAPYGVYTKFNLSMRIAAGEQKNFHAEKDGSDVVWIVSNCYTQNDRASYVQELGKHIKIDQFGSCNKRPLSKKDKRKILEASYFYLSFENTNCKEYITEKFWNNALRNNIIPVVMGAPKTDYLAVAPPHSFIHIEDYKSPKELSDYLLKVKKDAELYNSYFKWKQLGNIATSNFICDVCGFFEGQKNIKKIDHCSLQWMDDKKQCEPAKGPLAQSIVRPLKKQFMNATKN